MEKQKQFRGIFAIPQVIFNRDYSLNFTETERVIQFLLDCGVHGLVFPVYASEYYSLEQDERKKLLEMAVKAVKHKIPVVAGISAATSSLSVDLARHADCCGADAVISANPVTLSFSEAADYFKQIDQAVNIPVFIQNIGPAFGGKSMPGEVVQNIIGQLHNVCYLKEEGIASNKAIIQAVNAMKKMPDKWMGVMGGQGCRALIEEYRRGICGTMPPSQTADVLVDIWELLEAGKLEAGFALHTKLMPALSFAGNHKLPSYKEILKRRGVITSAVCRPHDWPVMDEASQKDLDFLMKAIEPLFRVRY